MHGTITPAASAPSSGQSILTRPFPFGVDVDTRESVALSLSHFLTSYWCVGEIGIGKSNHLLAPLYAALLSPLPGVIFDGAGTLATNLLHAVAAISSGRMMWSDRFPEFLRQAQDFVLRHPLIVFGDGARNISVNLLARHTLPSGERETLENVATRTYQIFNRLFADDAEKRVRFRRISMPILAVLGAAGRPIRDYKDLIAIPARGKDTVDVGGAFFSRCLREAGEAGIDAVDRRFYEDCVRAVRDMRRLAPSEFRKETESTDNAFNYFYTSPGADYVNEQTLDIPALLDHGGKLLTLPH